MGEERYLGARRAAEELGVSLGTLYAYVSRGLIRSEATGGRNRRYRAEDVRRLKERKERRRDPDRVVEDALHWGTPVMESAITLIEDDGLYYRGRDAVALAAGSTIEEVATLIWVGDPAQAPDLFPPAPPELPPRIRAALGSDLPPVEAFQVSLALAGAGDPASYDLRPAAVARTGGRILRLMAGVAAGAGDPRGAELLRRVTAAYPDSPDVALCAAVADEALELLGERPTVDFGLVTLARALGLPPGGAIALFALGRTVGWIGHAIEQYEGGSLIRPRARYVGEQPG